MIMHLMSDLLTVPDDQAGNKMTRLQQQLAHRYGATRYIRTCLLVADLLIDHGLSNRIRKVSLSQ